MKKLKIYCSREKFLGTAICYFSVAAIIHIAISASLGVTELPPSLITVLGIDGALVILCCADMLRCNKTKPQESKEPVNTPSLVALEAEFTSSARVDKPEESAANDSREESRFPIPTPSGTPKSVSANTTPRHHVSVSLNSSREPSRRATTPVPPSEGVPPQTIASPIESIAVIPLEPVARTDSAESSKSDIPPIQPQLLQVPSSTSTYVSVGRNKFVR